MGGQSFETTKMIKGARQRTEQKSETGGGAADYMAQVATIEQCDLRRTVQINDRKKLYFIEPFAGSTETTDTPSIRNSKSKTQQGGTVTIFYSVADTGERKTFFGLQARHLKIVQEMEASPDSCGGASKTRMEIDGWYVDFSAEFNCPSEIPQTAGQFAKPDCRDRVILKSSGATNPGFLLNGTTAFFDRNGNQTVSQTVETLELSRSPLAAALFDVPADYRLVSSPDELYVMPDMNDSRQRQSNEEQPASSDRSAKNVGLNIAFGSDAKVNQAEISRYLLERLRDRNFNAQLGAGGSRAEYVLNVEIIKVRESTASKVGGVFGKVTGVESKSGKTDVELVMTLAKSGSNVALGQTRTARKFDGGSAEALKAALDEALNNILAKIPDEE